MNRSARGFSIFEMLAVLAIMGIALAVVSPPLARSLGAIGFAAKADAVARDITGLRTRALLERRNLVFPAPGEAPYADLSGDLPEGWAVEGEPIAFLENGVCLGGALTISDGAGRSRALVLQAPDCRLDPVRRTEVPGADRFALRTAAMEARHL